MGRFLICAGVTEIYQLGTCHGDLRTLICAGVTEIHQLGTCRGDLRTLYWHVGLLLPADNFHERLRSGRLSVGTCACARAVTYQHKDR